MAKEKAKKKRADKYDDKVAINCSFEDVIKISANYTPKDKAKKNTPAKKKK